MRRAARARARRADPRARGRRRAGARPVPGDAAAVRAPRRSTRAPTGLGLLPGEVARLDARGLKLPHIGWNVVTLRARVAARSRGCREPTAFYHVHTFVPEPADEDDVARHGEYGEPFVSIVERGNVFGAQFHPEKSSRGRPARCSRTSRGICAAGGGVVILYPAIDISDGQGGAPRPGRLRRTRRSTATTRSRPRATWVEAGARLAARRRPRRRADRGRRRRSSTCERIAARADVPVQYGGGLRGLDGGARRAAARARAR